MHRKPAFSRRLLSRLPASEDVWVCWQCNGYDDFSRVLDISPHGLFLESSQSKLAVGMSTKLDFLVAEGRIRADAIIRHVRSGAGLGLKFAPLPEPDSTRLRSLLTRLRAS